MLWGEGVVPNISPMPLGTTMRMRTPLGTKYRRPRDSYQKNSPIMVKVPFSFTKRMKSQMKIFIEDENSSAPKPPSPILASCTFQITPGRTKEYILLVAPKNDEEGTANVYVIPFDQASIPTGSFSFSSRVGKTLIHSVWKKQICPTFQTGGRKGSANRGERKDHSAKSILKKRRKIPNCAIQGMATCQGVEGSRILN